MLRLRSLREVHARDLRALLEEEASHWAAELEWDYAPVTRAIADGLEGRAVSGCALQDGPRTVAYCYWLRENGRAVVGSAFAAADVRGQGLEDGLLDVVLHDAQAAPGGDRVEGQTLFSTTPSADQRYRKAGFVGCERQYLVRTLARTRDPDGGRWPDGTIRLRPLCRGDLPVVAELVYRSHVGSVDAAHNSTYATVERTRGFIEALVLRDACGRFEAAASFVAEGPTGAAGTILSSRLAAFNGHVCQVSVAPRLQGRGLGAALMQAALAALEREGCRIASLSVSSANEPAFRLYQRLGFETRKVYGAHAWLRPAGRSWA